MTILQATQARNDASARRADFLDTASAALEAKNVAGYDAAMARADEVTAEVERYQKLLDAMGAAGAMQTLTADAPVGKNLQEILDSKEYANAFANHLRCAARGDGGVVNAQDMQILRNALTESGGTPDGANGGFLVPTDVQTQIDTLLGDEVRLAPLFNVEYTNFISGTRVQDENPTAGFTKVSEMATIPQDDQPKFKQIGFTVDKYSLILPVSNELLSDNTANLFAYLARWGAEKQVLTENTLLLEMLADLTPTAIAYGGEIRGLNTALTVGLKSRYRNRANLITNQDGYNQLTNLVDSLNRPLLAPSWRDPDVELFRGKYPITVLDNDVLATDEDDGAAPIYIGDFKRYGTLFQRQRMQFASTNIGCSAFATDSTEIRFLTRMGTQKFRTDAALARTLATVAPVVEESDDDTDTVTP